MPTRLLTVFDRRLVAGLLFFALACTASAQAIDTAHRLEGFDAGFDAYMAKTLKDWNAPGVGVGIVVNDKLVFAKGYGYRDYEKKLPFTPGYDESHRVEYETVHCRRRRHAGRGRKADVGQAGARIRPVHPLFQRPAQRLP